MDIPLNFGISGGILIHICSKLKQKTQYNLPIISYVIRQA